MGISSSGETTVLNALLASRFVSLHTGDPGDAGANELSGGAYVRRSAAFTLTGSNPTVASNSAPIEYPRATSNWGTVTHFGLWSAVSAGVYLGGAALNSSKVVELDDVVRWAAGELEVECD